jgi:carbonic anhydrase
MLVVGEFDESLTSRTLLSVAIAPPHSPVCMQSGSCRRNQLTYELTPTGVKASYPGNDVCRSPSIKIPGVDGRYEASNVHIHVLSEHTVDGVHHGAEMHTVHFSADAPDRAAVVGMLIDPSSDETNSKFQTLLDAWQEVFEADEEACESGGRRVLTDSARTGNAFAPYDFLDLASTGFYFYDGGLTTPPCSEIVWWNVADQVVAVTPAQFSQLVDLTLHYKDPATCELGTFAGEAGNTARPVQPLNGREVDRICPKEWRPKTRALRRTADVE